MKGLRILLVLRIFYYYCSLYSLLLTISTTSIIHAFSISNIKSATSIKFPMRGNNVWPHCTSTLIICNRNSYKNNGNKLFRHGTLFTSTKNSQTTTTAVTGTTTTTTTDESSNDNKFSTKFIKNLRAAPFALSIIALFIGYKLGARSMVKSIAKSTSETAVSMSARGSTRSVVRQYPIVAIILLVVAIRDIWSLIPEWAKKNIPFVRRLYRPSTVSMDNEDEYDPDDLTSFSAISTKLRNLFKRGREKLATIGDDDIDNPVFVFLALIRLVSQFKQQLAKRRDQVYYNSGTDIPNPHTVLDGIDEAFEFADWAYNEFDEGQSLKGNLAEKGYSLLRHETTALPGHVAHYIAVSPERMEALIGIKGTSNFEDMLTDCCGNVVKYKFENDTSFIDGGRTEISCHEGVLLSSKRLADDLYTFVNSVLLPSGYKIRVTGHSLGAGVAVIFSMILRSRIEELRNDNGDKLKVLAFASPPILDYQASCNCESFVTTYINNSDIIPRASLSNLVLLMEFMRTVNKRLDEEGLNPKGIRSTARFLKMLTTDTKHSDMIMQPDEIRDATEDALEKVIIDDPDHLYVAGCVIHMYDEWTKENYGNKSDYENVGDDDFDTDLIVPTAEKVYEADGSAKALRIIEIDDRMMSDHMSPGYRASIRSLLDKKSRTT